MISNGSNDLGSFNIPVSKIFVSILSGVVVKSNKSPLTLYLDLMGTKLGAENRGLKGVLSVQSVSSVPERGTGSLLLAGLSMVGLMARRRKVKG